MSIVFGWNRLTLKKLSLEELNVEAENLPSDSKIVISQAYFHLFWIPFFPIGRRYTLEIRGVDYELPIGLQRHVEQLNIKAKGKWYAWSLFFLAAIIGLGIYINDKIEHQNNLRDLEAFNKQQAEQRREEKLFFDNPTVGSIIQVEGSNPHTRRHNIYFDAQYAFEIEKVTKDSVLVLIDRMEEMENVMRFQSLEGDLNIGIDTLEAIFRYRNTVYHRSKYLDSIESKYPNQKMMQKMLVLGLENQFKSYDLVNIPMTQFKKLKQTVGTQKSVAIDAFSAINAGWVRVKYVNE